MDYLAGTGTQTSALAFGRNTPPAAAVTTESWNGTSWTASPKCYGYSKIIN
jgi:hypothetical protein